jgi:hypothetical protein
MKELEGRWAQLPGGSVVRIVAVDVEDGVETVLAESIAGSEEQRPLSYVRARWRLLPDDGLIVLAATRPAEAKRLADDEPNELIALALHELDGDATTDEIQGLLERALGIYVGGRAGVSAWWKRVQPRLRDDPRIDASRGLDKRYRLSTGEARLGISRERIGTARRLGRRTAYAPLLKRSRAAARDKRHPMSTETRSEAEEEAALASRTDLDATDRFLAAELGTWLGTITASDAIRLLGDDLLEVDLLRILQKDSKTRVLRWLDEHMATRPLDSLIRAEATAPAPTTPDRLAASYQLEESTSDGLAELSVTKDPARPLQVDVFVPAVLASALAAGPPWSDAAEGLARDLGMPLEVVVARAVAWAAPGSEESRPWKLPDDFEPYRTRLERLANRYAAGGTAIRMGLERGAIEALDVLRGADKHPIPTADVVGTLGGIAASARFSIPAHLRTPLARIAGLAPDRLAALLQVRGGSDGAGPDSGYAPLYREALELAFERDPDAYSPVLELFADLMRDQPAGLALRLARRAAANARVLAMALVSSRLAARQGAEDAAAGADSAALAGTLAPDDPLVQRMTDAIADRAADDVLDGIVSTPGSLVFRPASWRRFALRMHGRLEDAARAVAEADAGAAEARSSMEVARLEAVQARDALAGTRTTAESASRTSSARVAANVLRPVAIALADSIEAPGLEALQDRLAAILERAGIETTILPGEQQRFDPSIHRWVDDGDPTDLIVAISPGFAARLEGGNAITIVPARVVASRPTAG